MKSHRRVCVVSECNGHHALNELMAWEIAQEEAERLRLKGYEVKYLNVLKDKRGFSYEIDYKTVM